MPFEYLTQQQLHNTPSIREGLTFVQEGRKRRQIIRFIKGSTQELKLPGWVAETAANICLRFYTRRSIARNDPFTIGAASLFLACKIESSPRALLDVVAFCWKQRNKSNPQELNRVPADKALTEGLCNDVAAGEMAILLALGFELNYPHPQKHIFDVLKELDLLHHPSKLYQKAINFCVDSLDTTIPLEYPPEKVAMGALWAAVRLVDVTLPLKPGETFAQRFELDQAEVTEVADRMIEMYEPGAPVASSGQPQAAPAAPAAADATPAPPQAQLAAPADSAASQQGGTSAEPGQAPPMVFTLNVQQTGSTQTAETYTVRVERDGNGTQLPSHAVAAAALTVINQHAAVATVAHPVPTESTTGSHASTKTSPAAPPAPEPCAEPVKAPISPEAAAESQRCSKKRQLELAGAEGSPNSSTPPAKGAAEANGQAAKKQCGVQQVAAAASPAAAAAAAGGGPDAGQ